MASGNSESGGEPQHPSVLLVIGSLQAGGAERVMSDMANYWSRKGWRVTVATWCSPDYTDFYKLDPDVRREWLHIHAGVSLLPRRIGSNFLRMRKLQALLTKLRPDAVVSFIDTSNVLTILAATGLGVRVVVSERVHPAHHAAVSWPWRILRRTVYRRANAVVAQTEEVARWLQERCGANACVIPNPLRKLPDSAGQREPLILGVGRLSVQKGFDVLLRAFAKIADTFTGWRVVILGRGPEKDALSRMIRELGLIDRVEIKDTVTNVESWMSRASVVVQPSRYEGFPNVLLEAMGMGAAVVSADCPAGPSEIIRDGENGRLVSVDDVDALARAMAELMSDPGLRRRLGEAAIEVRDRFQQDRIMACWEACVLRPAGEGLCNKASS